jgi:regulator of replication initiation timing
MSGIDISKKQKENKAHVCEPCMDTVTQTFSHFLEQIAKLVTENTQLQMELEKTREEQQIQKQTLMKEIRALKAKLAKLEHKQ